MHHVYIIQSEATNELYYGQTSDMKQRLESHNSGNNRSTKSGIPWKLIYCESYRVKADATAREAKLKQYGNSRTYVKKRIENSLL